MARLAGAEVVADPEPEGERNALRTYLECLRRTPEGATHRCVIQDDAWPCRGFRELAEQAVAERPDAIIAFFVPGANGGGRHRIRRARETGERWAQIGLGGWVPVVATSWPAELARDCLAFAESFSGRIRRADDALATRFARYRRCQVWATVPSLVEHPDRVPSLLGKNAGAGRNRGRVAEFVADLQ